MSVTGQPGAAAPAVSDGLVALLENAVLAPSSHNTQPWVFRIGDGRIELCADRTRALPVNDPRDRELVVSCGAALYNLRLAARCSRYEVDVSPLPDASDPDLLARVELRAGAPPTAAEERLFAAIPSRATFRKRFADRDVAGTLVSELVEAAEHEGAWLEVLGDTERRHDLAELVAEGDRALFADPRWRRELAAWLHPRRRGDGLPVPAIVTPIARLVVTAFDLGYSTGARDERLAEGSPLLAVLGTSGDVEADWLAAGQALERVLLAAAAEGVQAAFLNQPCQVADLRPRLAHLAGRPGFPQIVLRLGYPGEEVGHTARRPLGDVVEHRTGAR